MKEKINILLELTKIRITFFVTVTTAFGFIAAVGGINLKFIPTVLGILIIACGSAVLNHYQERNYDALMDRTKNRPIPAGRISAPDSLKISVILIVLGSMVLFIGAGFFALGLALINLFWYNVVYTLFKRKSPFAIVPGSLVGAIPPAVGWIAAGGSITDPQIIAISFFFFIWQIPHFWLLVLVLDKDYRLAGFPTLTQIFEKKQLARITFIWIVATAVTGLLIPMFGLVAEPIVNISLFLGGVWLTWQAFKILIETDNNISFRFAFRYINYFALFVILVVSIDKLLL